MGPVFTGLEPKSKAKAVVYVYRPTAFTGSARSPDIVLSGNKIGPIASGGYFFVEAEPGPQKIVMRNFAGEETGEFGFTLKADQIYFLRVDLSLPSLLKRYDASGKTDGTACLFMGVNIMLPPSDSEIMKTLRAMDQRLQATTCSPGFMFVAEELARRELPGTKLVVIKKP